MKKRIVKVKKISSDEITVFCDHIATLLNSGISLYEGVSVLCNEMEEGYTKELLHHIEKNLQARLSLSQALSNTGAFPEYMIQMVRVGETSGSLEKVMYSLSAYYERESKVKASIRSSVSYPAMLFLMIAVIIWALVFRILPLFETMYQELNAEIATTTDNLMTFGVNAGFIAAAIVGLLVMMLLFLFLIYRTKQGEKLLKRVLFNLPITKGIARRVSIEKFISSMALMLPSGLDTRKALDLAMETMDNPVVLAKVKECKDLVDNGISLENAIQQSNLITGMDRNIIIVSAKSGNLDTAFIKLSERYNNEVTILLNKTATYVEMVFVVLLAVLIGFILLSVMLPLMNIISSIG